MQGLSEEPFPPPSTKDNLDEANPRDLQYPGGQSAAGFEGEGKRQPQGAGDLGAEEPEAEGNDVLEPEL